MKTLDDLHFFSREKEEYISLAEIERIFNTKSGDMSTTSQLCRELRSMWIFCSFLRSVIRSGGNLEDRDLLEEYLGFKWKNL